MSAELEIRDAYGSRVGAVMLGEIDAETGEPAIGEERAYVLVNTGTTIFQNIAVAVHGPGAEYIALAVDADDHPGIWAEPGRSIVPDPNRLRPGERARIWAQARFGPGDLENAYEFDLRITAQSVAQSTEVSPS